MAWEPIRLDREPSFAELRDGLAAVLRVAAEVVDVGEQLEKLRSDAIVMAAVRREDGAENCEFPAILDVVAKDDELGRPLDHAAVGALCAELGCRALVDDDGDNPYCFLLLTADDPPRAVLVDRASFDEGNAIVIAGEATDADRRATPQGPVSQRRPTPPPPASSKD